MNMEVASQEFFDMWISTSWAIIKSIIEGVTAYLLTHFVRSLAEAIVKWEPF